MNLNKYRNRRRLNYDGNRIIQIGKKELYFFVYEHIWDLTIYNADVLEQYGLHKARYIYIGQSKAYNLKARSSKRRDDVEKNLKQNKEVTKFLRKYKIFLCHETDLIQEEIREVLYYNGKIRTRCLTKAHAKQKEEEYNGNYHWNDMMGEILETHIILLSKKDSGFREIKDGAVRILQDKNHKTA